MNALRTRSSFRIRPRHSFVNSSDDTVPLARACAASVRVQFSGSAAPRARETAALAAAPASKVLLVTPSELIAPTELDYARSIQSAAVFTEPNGVAQAQRQLVRVEAHRIGEVKCLGANLNAVFFVVKHGEPL